MPSEKLGQREMQARVSMKLAIAFLRTAIIMTVSGLYLQAPALIDFFLFAKRSPQVG
jgi:hypothetical protein